MSRLVADMRWLTLAAWLFWFIAYWQGGRRVVADIRKSVTSAHTHLDAVWNGVTAGLVMLAYALKAGDEDNFVRHRLPGNRAYQQRVPYRLILWLW